MDTKIICRDTDILYSPHPNTPIQETLHQWLVYHDPPPLPPPPPPHPIAETSLPNHTVGQPPSSRSSHRRRNHRHRQRRVRWHVIVCGHYSVCVESHGQYEDSQGFVDIKCDFVQCHALHCTIFMWFYTNNYYLFVQVILFIVY